MQRNFFKMSNFSVFVTFYFRRVALVHFMLLSTLPHESSMVTQKAQVQETVKKEYIYEGRYGNMTWPFREQVAKIEGNITIGGLMMVHERDEMMICGKIMPQGGLQATEAMLYTVDKVNSMEIIPGIKLGARIKDDCDRDIYGLEQSVDFIRGSISNIGKSSEYDCKDGSKPEMMAGVVGAASSVTSMQVANLLKLFQIPQVSFFSTSRELSNDERYPFFLRTIPSDKNQAEAMVELVKFFGWKYVSIVYEESSYGQQAFQVLDELLREANVCVAVTDYLIKDSGVARESKYDKTVKNLLQYSDAKGVIIFGSDQEVAELMRAVRRLNGTGTFSWIGSDGWGGRSLVSEHNEPEVEGAITVQPYATPIHGFEDYFLNLRPWNNTRNPWFVEYWEDYFQCRYKNSADTPINIKYKRQCNGTERMTKENGYEPEAQLQFVSEAVMSFAYALRNMHRDYCHGVPGFCKEMYPYNGPLLLKYLLNITFKGLSGEQFRFLSNGDGLPRYRILNFRQRTKGKYEWVTVGMYEDRKLKINLSEIQFRHDQRNHPESVCSQPCGNDQAQSFIKGDTCCWTCVSCTQYQYVSASKEECIDCPYGTMPDSSKVKCVDIPQMYLTYDSGIAIGAMAFAAIGILVTVYIIVVFIQYRDTPVVRASGRELSFVLLFGILICYGMTFVIISKPTDVVCGAQKIGIGLCFSICYSALLTKTNRIARIFRAGKRTVKRPRCISPKSQLLICAGLVSVQIAIALVWLWISPPKAGPYYPTRKDNQLVCLSAVGMSYMIGFSYPILLIIICTVYAVLTRKIPEAFNESKHIGFTMYTTCIIWLAFVPIYFSTANNIEIRLATICFSISLSSTVSLVCLFTPKLHIILLHPERNVRQSMMASKNMSKQNSSASRMDSGTQSDGEIELHQRLKPSMSMSSGFSRSTSATQTCSNGTSISTQTLDSIGREFDDMDVQL